MIFDLVVAEFHGGDCLGHLISQARGRRGTLALMTTGGGEGGGIDTRQTGGGWVMERMAVSVRVIERLSLCVACVHGLLVWRAYSGSITRMLTHANN